MKRFVYVLVLLSASALLSGFASADIKGAVARFREVEVAHFGGAGFGGATEVWHNRIYTTRGSEPIGDSYYACVTVDPVTLIRQCTSTYMLPNGFMALHGLVEHRGHYKLIITSADGIYHNRKGTMQADLFAHRKNQWFVTFYFE